MMDQKKSVSIIQYTYIYSIHKYIYIHIYTGNIYMCRTIQYIEKRAEIRS